MTTRPLMWTLPSSLRMASTAALSAAFSSPRPLNLAAEIAAASVTRATSRTRMRSRPPDSSTLAIASLPCCRACPPSQRFYAYHLRRLGHVAVAVDRLKCAPDGLLGGLVGNQDDRRRRAGLGPRVDTNLGAARAALHDALQRHLPLAHAPGDGGH